MSDLIKSSVQPLLEVGLIHFQVIVVIPPTVSYCIACHCIVLSLLLLGGLTQHGPASQWWLNYCGTGSKRVQFCRVVFTFVVLYLCSFHSFNKCHLIGLLLAQCVSPSGLSAINMVCVPCCRRWWNRNAGRRMPGPRSLITPSRNVMICYRNAQRSSAGK